MFEIRAYKTLAVIVSLGLVLAACDGQGQNDSVIATAVAQTVEANQSSAPLLAIPTSTSELPLTTPQPTLIPENTPTSASTLVSAPSDPSCIHANLISEYPPDGTVYKPGTAFTKTWTIKNEGTCTWDSTYKLIFWSGEIMGGSTYYDLPEVVQPGDDISIVVQFLAPTIEGNYTGYWRLQTPWNEVFGVGQYSQAFYANIVVDKKPGQEYGIVNLEYEIVRNPAEGCPANVEYTVYATITTNGPFDFNYYWAQKDGNDSAVKNMVFDEAGSKTISRSWLVGRGNSPNDRWMQIIVVWPELIEFPQATWPNNCP